MPDKDLTDHDLLIRIDQRVQGIEKTLDSNQAAIESLELSRAKFYGMAAAVSFVFSVAGMFVGKIVLQH